MRILRLLRWLLRGIAVATFVAFGLAILVPRFSHSLAHNLTGKVLVLWSLCLSVLLPLYLAGEAWVLRKLASSTAEWAAFRVDAVIGMSYCAFLWGSIIWGLGRYAIP